MNRYRITIEQEKHSRMECETDAPDMAAALLKAQRFIDGHAVRGFDIKRTYAADPKATEAETIVGAREMAP